MSFAYIDSQGKEVPIPGPDALRLRIELGAITDTTQFYDDAADRWAPASEHEIFRQLKRQLEHGEADMFVAPPPSAIDAPALEELSAPEEPSAREEESAEPDDPEFGTGMDDMEFAESILDMELTATDPTGSDSLLGGDTTSEGESESESESEHETGTAHTVLDLGADDLTLAEPPEEAPQVPASEAFETPFYSTAGSAPDAVEDDSSDPPPVTLPDVDSTADTGPDSDPFEFGSGDLTLAGDAPMADEVPPEDTATEERAPGQWNVSEDLANSAPLPGDELDPVSDFNASQGLELEDDEEVVDVGGGLEVEGSDITDYDPDLPPAWAEDAPEVQEEEEENSASAELDSGSEIESGPEERRDPYQRNIRERTGPRSAPPQRSVTPRSAGTGKLVGIAAALIIVLGGGTWFVLRSGGDARATAESAIQLPALPADLQPQLRQLAQRASRRMVEAFDSLPERVALPAEPGERWLSGRYLASASAFPGVESYWTDFGVLLDEMVATDDAIWTAAFEEEVVAANMTVENTQMIRERGMLGWEASSSDRQIVYDQLRRVINAALDLHQFLVENESEIAYTARGAVGGDPFSEIQPSSDVLADQILGRVSAIPENLDALGYLQQVETEPLFGAVKEKLVATGIR